MGAATPPRPRVQGGQCVLTLHRVVESPERDHDLAWGDFIRLLDAIGSAGAPVSTDLHAPERHAGAVVLTFDDGTADHLRAAEELAGRGMSGIFFVPVHFLGEESRLSSSDVKTVVELGHTVGSHTLDHARLDDLGEAELNRQAIESKEQLEAIAGTTVEYFAPPGGSWHPLLATVLDGAGYSASRSTQWGFYRSTAQRWRIPCFPVTHYSWRAGWIEKTLQDWDMPALMKAVWGVRRRMPASAAVRIRRSVLDRAQPRRRGHPPAQDARGQKVSSAAGRDEHGDGVSITFVSGTRDSAGARTPEGGIRWFPGSSLIAALERKRIPVSTLITTTKMISIPWGRTRGYRSTRGVPVSPRFLLDLARSPSSFLVCNEYGVEALVALVAARLRGRHGLVFQQNVGRGGDRLSAVDVRYRRLFARLASGFIANTPAARDEIVQVLHAEPARVFQIMTHVPPDREELCVDPIDVGSPRARPLFLFVGQLIVRKNVDGLLRAAAQLVREGLDFEVWIVGEGPEEARLRRMVADLDLEGSVRFLGPIRRSSVGFAYSACDVFVMPSHADLLSVAVLEAVRFGMAVICSTAVGSAGVVVHDGLNGLSFDPSDPSEPSQLADGMRRFVLEPELAAEMGAHSQAIMDEHTPDAAASALVEALESLASGKV